MIDFTTITEDTIVKMYERSEIGPYYAAWILSKRFNKGYKTISKLLNNSLVANNIKELSNAMYKSKKFSRDTINLLVTDFNMIDEKVIIKLVTISKALYFIDSVDYSDSETVKQIVINKKNSDPEYIELDSKLSQSLPDFDRTLVKYVLNSKNRLNEVLKKLDVKELKSVRDSLLTEKKQEEDNVPNYVDDILSAFD